MQLNKNIIIFKNITEGFMNLKYINSLAEIFDKKKELKDKFVFILENNASNEVNQAIMQMFNKLIGFNIFVAASSNGQVLEYKPLNELQLKHKIEGVEISLQDYLNNKYKDYQLNTHIVENDIYQNIISIIEEEI